MTNHQKGDLDAAEALLFFSKLAGNYRQRILASAKFFSKMLKQILHDMYVDPDILAGLDETYKQTLFCKMREEQIRRWRVWDEQQQEDEKPIKKSKVSFRTDEDGEPWVWIMGEHKDDLTIEQILEEEAKHKARQIAETEFRKSMIEYETTAAKKLEEVELKSPKIMDDMEIYCSVDELQERTKPSQLSEHNLSPLSNFKHIQNYSNRLTKMKFSSSSGYHDKFDVLQEISSNRSTQKVAARIAQWEQRTIGQRTSEIFQQIQKRKQESVKEADEAAKKQEELWIEQERKAKQAEFQMRAIARRAREEHRKSLSCDDLTTSPSPSPPNSLDPSIARPPNKEAVIQWYRNSEFPRRAGLEDSGRPQKWFHGLLSRQEAERLLDNEDQGSFLVRISEKIWGYAISYKEVRKCKHYLVDASSGNYQFLGQNQKEHSSLCNLVRHHGSAPITVLGNELLIKPCSNKMEIPSGLEDLIDKDFYTKTYC